MLAILDSPRLSLGRNLVCVLSLVGGLIRCCLLRIGLALIGRGQLGHNPLLLGVSQDLVQW